MTRNDDRAIGSLRRQTPAILAGRVAWVLHQLGEARAVTIDPEGRVWIERYEDAAFDDVIGQFDPSAGQLALTRVLRDEFAAARDALPPERRRMVLGQRERAKRAVRS